MELKDKEGCGHVKEEKKEEKREENKLQLQ